MCVCVWRGVYSWVVGGGRSVCVCVCGGVCTGGWWEWVGLYVCVCVWRGLSGGWWEGVGLYVCVCVWRGLYSWVVGGGRSVCVCVCVEGCVLVGGGRG